MIRSDRNFDDLYERFVRNIYGSAKGELRMAVIWQHLLDTLPELTAGKPLRILDAGCGLGQMGLKLAELGHELVLADLSATMVQQAQATFAEALPSASVTFIHGPVQMLNVREHGQFDLVLFHAVLEWLAEPKQTLQQLLQLITPRGGLSLMFYNRDALIFRNLIRGNWRKAESEHQGGEGSGLTPYHPHSLADVQAWLADWQFDLLGRAGVRVIHDYMEPRVHGMRTSEEMVRIELKYARQEPFLYMGRYLHLIARKGVAG
ncbi:methyltransferase domain-containing protein [Mariprofundus erugo]|uniref:methyltransferase domain-containing protein n=1 Tax=Mariprofundus erugo TaxID=2528639 RepID=UPI0010FD0FAF|nr:methyltransferase domain-containing protein [Mariprofundus erugo]TLS76955.1 methyltransferase domain-containing protein [Mariprofundus erugo]